MRQSTSVTTGPATDWVAAFADDLFAYAVRRVRRADVAEDLVQETLLAAVRDGPAFAGRSNPRTWLTGILRHKIGDHFRAAYRRTGVASLDPQGVPESDDDAGPFDRRGRWRTPVAAWPIDPARATEDRELRAALDGCLAKLPPRMATLFLGRAADGLATARLCAELGLEPAHAWVLLHRARLRLRQCLTATWFTTPARRRPAGSIP